MFFNKLGNIKIGGTENGLPQQFTQLFVTKASKNGEEKFEAFNDNYKDGLDSISVTLPFVEDINKNFDSGLISFILINDSVKYYAKDVKGEILLFPLQPNFKNPNLDLPVIKLGKTEDWLTKLDMKNRAILYLYISKKTNEQVIELEGESAGVFLFKTASAHSIKDIQNTLKLVDGFEKSVLRLSEFKFEMHSRLLNLGKLEDISYARLMPPSTLSIAKASKLNSEYPDLSKYLGNLEKNEKTLREESINNAINLDEAEKFFGKKVTFKLDQALGFDLTPMETTKEKKEEDPKITELADKLHKEYDFPVLLLKSLINKTGLDKAEEVVKTKKTTEDIINFISDK